MYRPYDQRRVISRRTSGTVRGNQPCITEVTERRRWRPPGSTETGVGQSLVPTPDGRDPSSAGSDHRQRDRRWASIMITCQQYYCGQMIASVGNDFAGLWRDASVLVQWDHDRTKSAGWCTVHTSRVISRRTSGTVRGISLASLPGRPPFPRSILVPTPDA